MKNFFYLFIAAFVFIALIKNCRNASETLIKEESEVETQSKPAPKVKLKEKSLCLPPFDLTAHLIKQAETFTAQKIPYSSAKATDCSGMFHRMIDAVKEHCPDSDFPSLRSARSSRDIAGWYHGKGKFKIIRDPAKSNHLIRPGVIMFYGYQYKEDQYKRSAMNIADLMKRGTGINHVAIVTSVEQKDGVVESYEIFHGRNPKYPAGITKCWLKRHSFPVYGNGPEPWLGVVASVLTEK